jgi:hypothetical protein
MGRRNSQLKLRLSLRWKLLLLREEKLRSGQLVRIDGRIYTRLYIIEYKRGIYVAEWQRTAFILRIESVRIRVICLVKCYLHKKLNALRKQVLLAVLSNSCCHFTLAMITSKYLLTKSILDLNYRFKPFQRL